MSQENVEVVRKGFEAYVRGGAEAMLGMLDESIEWKQVEEPAAVHGIDAVRAAVQGWDEMWDKLEADADEFIDAGDDVVVRIRYHGLGKASGAHVAQASYHVFTVRDGKVVRMFEHGTVSRAEVLQTVGLPD